VSDTDIKAEYNENYRDASQFWAPYQKDAEIFTLAASGMTWTERERKQLIQEGREPIELNIMRRPLSFFSGYLRDNLNSIYYSPVEGSDNETSEQLTKLGLNVWDKGGGYTEFLDGYDEAFKSGMSLNGIMMDYSNDFIDGDIKFYNRTYNSFYLDPNFTKINLQDCGYAITRDLVNDEGAKKLLHNHVDTAIVDDLSRSFRDDKFIKYRPNVTTQRRSQNTFAYDQYYRRTTRMRKFLVDMESSFFKDISDLPADEMKKLEFGIKRLASTREEFATIGEDLQEIPNVEIRSIERSYIELHVFLNGELVYSGEDDTKIVETYPFAPGLCYFEKSIWIPSQRVQGMASTQFSNQRNFNKRHMKIIDMMDSVISTGYKYLIGSVPDIDDMQQAGQNRLIGIDPDNAPEGLNSVQQLQSTGPDNGFLQYQDILDKLSLTLGNVTEATLGMDDKQNSVLSGRLAQVQIAQNLLANRKVFDNVAETQQVLGSLVLKAIQRNYSPGKVERILGEPPTDQFYDTEFEQYDAVIKEGIRSKSQKDAYYYELVNLKREGIVDVPQAEIVRALQISGISELQEAIQAQQEQQQIQLDKIDRQEEVALQLSNSQKIANLSLAKEREARVLSDIGLAEERHSEAASNQADAVLARAKAMVELSNLNEDRIMKVYEFMEAIHTEEEREQEKISKQTDAKADKIDQRKEISQAIETQPSEKLESENISLL